MGKAYTNTPAGVLSGFVALERPSTKFDDDGVYSCSVDFTGKAATEMKDIVDGLMTESAAEGLKNGIKKTAEPPYTIDNKVLTVRFKQKAQIKSKAGKVFELNVKLYDAKGKEIETETDLGTGSTVKIAFSSYMWALALTGADITLQPACVQIIDLVKYEGGDIENPFEATDGYVAAEKEEIPFEEVPDDEEENDEDF